MPLPKFSASSPRVLREAGGVSDAPKDLPVVTPGPLVGVDDPDDPRLDLYRDLNDPAGRLRLAGGAGPPARRGAGAGGGRPPPSRPGGAAAGGTRPAGSLRSR